MDSDFELEWQDDVWCCVSYEVQYAIVRSSLFIERGPDGEEPMYLTADSRKQITEWLSQADPGAALHPGPFLACHWWLTQPHRLLVHPAEVQGQQMASIYSDEQLIGILLPCLLDDPHASVIWPAHTAAQFAAQEAK